MYTPKAFQVTDQDVLQDFIAQNSFGVLLSLDEKKIEGTHLPLLYDAETNQLIGHVARANQQWQHANGVEVLAIFHGPHSYISSSWYEEDNTVPTWNYTAVHVYGKLEVIQEAEKIVETMDKTVAFYDPDLDLKKTVSEKSMAGLLQGIVAFQIQVTKWEGKWKLSQNHSTERQKRVIEQLSKSSNQQDIEIAKLMKQSLTES
ncbi:FMN-binding negative transcriptional regulator [Bacillus horti]|uniref:Transcriptional regulator n=1 Tax=Caldalkalibacillus horti TaxID=77523 RepID=A0ABT9VX86_9BACI|nr:FMN-binding negative transcriptional regulator [Bacillus horti]MDQ0165608.1 transcriptional regulator [Bacillus horti]